MSKKKHRRDQETRSKGIAVSIDYHHALFAELIKNRMPDVVTLREEPAASLTRRFCSLIEHESPIPMFRGISYIKTLQGMLENEMRKIVSSRSIHYWYHLYRRHAPGSNFPNNSPVTIEWYTSITDCAYLKFGRLSIGDELVTDPISTDQVASGLYTQALKNLGVDPTQQVLKGVYLGRFGFDDFVDDSRVERLAFEYWYTTSCLRRLYKGGVLYVDVASEDVPYSVRNDPDTEKLIASYDDRNVSYGREYTMSGIPIGKYPDSFGKAVFVPRRNIHCYTAKDVPTHMIFGLPKDVGDFEPNFIWAPFDLDAYYVRHRFLRDRFTKVFGFSLEDFVDTLYLVLTATILQSREDKRVSLQFIQRGYQYIGPVEVYAESLMNRVGAKVLPSLAQFYGRDLQTVVNVLKHFMLTEQERDRVSLTTCGPRPLVIPLPDNRSLIDYGSIWPILDTQMKRLDSESEDFKGHLFEDVVADEMRTKGFQEWAIKTELRHPDGTKKEIDLSYIVDNVLVLCEQKCHNLSFAFEEGRLDALQYRQSAMESSLEQVDTKAEWLSQRRCGLNYNLPQSVTAIVPIVVSPFVEYIWSPDGRLWLTDAIPRVCTPSELERILVPEKIQSFMGRSFVRTVH